MKKVNVLSVLTLLFVMFLGTYAKAADFVSLNGASNTALGTYQIMELPSENVKGATMRKFELKYENAKEAVVIYLSDTPKCREYAVLSNGLDIQYVCSKKSFGAKALSGKMLRHNPDVDAIFVNADELARQQKISEGELGVETALGYIACYYPALVKHIDLL